MKIYLSEHIHPDALSKLKERFEVVDHFNNPEELDAILVRIVEVRQEVIKKAKNLKVIGKHGIGYNNIDAQAAKELGIKVVNTPLANMNSVAELIVALVLDVSRNISVLNVKVRKSEIRVIAPNESTGIEIAGKTLGLIGMGNIARTAANILKNGFNVNVVGYDPYFPAERAAELGIKKYDTVEELISVSDIVNVSVPLTEGTKDLINTKQFDYFKPGAILINTARGGIVNEQALYQALKDRKLRGAACDVFLTEPPTADNPLIGLDNFVATPHIGANTEEALYKMGMTVVEDIISVIDGKEPKFPVA